MSAKLYPLDIGRGDGRLAVGADPLPEHGEPFARGCIRRALEISARERVGLDPKIGDDVARNALRGRFVDRSDSLCIEDCDLRKRLRESSKPSEARVRPAGMPAATISAAYASAPTNATEPDHASSRVPIHE